MKKRIFKIGLFVAVVLVAGYNVYSPQESVLPSSILSSCSSGHPLEKASLFLIFRLFVVEGVSKEHSVYEDYN